MKTRLKVATEAAHKANKLALSLFENRSEMLIQSKRPKDFVSQADSLVETQIRANIAATFPDDALMGEEMGGATADAFWCIDPIDGTANFLKGSPLWGISIAYIEQGQPQIGVISLPCLNLFVSAQHNAGAFCNGKRIKQALPVEVRIASVGENPFWPSATLAKLERSLRDDGWGVAEYRCATVALVFAALGFTDGYLEKMTNIWDVAAGAVICQEAGLRVDVGGDSVPAGVSIRVGSDALLASIDALWSQL